MEVFIVITGGMYEPRISRVFSTKYLAEKYISSFGEGGYAEWEIENWDVDEYKDELSANKKLFFIQIQKDGRVLTCENCNSDSWMEGVNKVTYGYYKTYSNHTLYANNSDEALELAMKEHELHKENLIDL